MGLYRKREADSSGAAGAADATWILARLEPSDIRRNRSIRARTPDATMRAIVA